MRYQIQRGVQFENPVLYEQISKVVAYKNGKRWAEDLMKTTGRATRLLLKADGCVRPGVFISGIPWI